LDTISGIDRTGDVLGGQYAAYGRLEIIVRLYQIDTELLQAIDTKLLQAAELLETDDERTGRTIVKLFEADDGPTGRTIVELLQARRAG
jgi:hypothetical protein